MSARITAHLTAPAGFGSAPASVRDTAWAVLRRVWIAVTTRSQLAELDARMLQDIGLTKAEVATEIARAPWDTAPVRRGDRPL